MNFTLETGTNLTLLGILFLAFKFILPFIIGVILITIGYFALKYLFEKLQIEDENLTWLLLFGLFVLLVIIYMI